MEVNCIATYRNVGGVFDIVVGNHNLEFEPRHATLSDSPHPEHRLACPSHLAFPGLNLQHIPNYVDCKTPQLTWMFIHICFYPEKLTHCFSELHLVTHFWFDNISCLKVTDKPYSNYFYLSMLTVSFC